MKQFRSAAFTITLLAVLLWAAAVACSAQAPLWRFSHEGSTVYLFGTVHFLPPGATWFDDELQQIVASADSLIVEVAPDELHPEHLQRLIISLGFLPVGTTLHEVLSEEAFSRLAEALDAMGVPVQIFNGMRPWLVEIEFSNLLFQRAGFSAEAGADLLLLSEAARLNIPIQSLESAEFQLQIFASLPAEVQERSLLATLDQQHDIERIVSQLADAWLNGDVDALESLVFDEMTDVPEYKEAVFVERNRAWADRIPRLIEGGGVHFVAVGVGHLIGENSLVELLEEAGYAVQRSR